MRCQLCASFGDSSFNFDDLRMESLRKHSEIHQIQIDRISEGPPKSNYWKWEIFKRCFPHAANALKRFLNAKLERRRSFLKEQKNGNNSNKKTKRSIPDGTRNREDAKSDAEIEPKLEPPPPKKRGEITTDHNYHTVMGGGSRRYANAIRRHCYDLKRKFSQNNKMTCRLCSKEMVVGKKIQNVLDHATRIHFDHPLFTCLLCKKQFSAYFTMALHIRDIHRQSATGAYIDNCMDYENEIIQVLTKCYGAHAKVEKHVPLLEMTPPGNKELPADTVGPTNTNTGNESRVTVAIKKWFRGRKREFGGMNCRICAKRIRAESIEAVSHVADVHFGETIFSCRLCSKSFGTYCRVKSHIRSYHNYRVKGSYVSRVQQYEKKILELLEKCFGEVEKVETKANVQPKSPKKNLV